MSASAFGTKDYFHKIPIPLSRQKTFDGLAVSVLGAGTYLGAADDATDSLYLKTLIDAGLGGVNCFDTSINYRGQRSEKILGKAMLALHEKGISRESFVIATKGGFFPNVGSPETFDDYVRTRFLDTGIVKPQEIVAGSHCMSSAFLSCQIDESLKNMQVNCIDQYYLHHPEIQLAEIGEEAFYKRLGSAFLLLEQKVTEKKIARYGLATWNGFRQKKGAIQLEKVLQCAKNAGGDSHHFKSIQVPFNLVMPEAVTVENQIFGKEKWSIAKAAAESGIYLMASSPLMQGQVGLLCSRVFEILPKEPSRMVAALQFVLSAPQVCITFAGMTERTHWAENQKALQEAPWSLRDWSAACERLGIIN